MARRFDRGPVIIGGACLATFAALQVLDCGALRFGLGALLAAGAAYTLLGPAMTAAIRLLSAWMSSRP